MITDHVADMLTRLRNATLAKHSAVKLTYTKLNVAILNVLFSEGLIERYKIDNLLNPRSIEVLLKYKGWWIKKPSFTKIQRICRPGKRVFSSYKKLQLKLDGLRYQQGIAILSTSSGVMSHRKAMILKKGGEIVCYIDA